MAAALDDAPVDQMENYLTIYYYIDIVFRGGGGVSGLALIKLQISNKVVNLS